HQVAQRPARRLVVERDLVGTVRRLDAYAVLDHVGQAAHAPLGQLEERRGPHQPLQRLAPGIGQLLSLDDALESQPGEAAALHDADPHPGTPSVWTTPRGTRRPRPATPRG